MDDFFSYRRKEKTVGDVLEFRQGKADRKVEHVDSSTIVEKLELTAELRAEFEAQGYSFEEYDNREDRETDDHSQRVRVRGSKE